MSGDGAITAQEVLSLQAVFTTTKVCARSRGMISRTIKVRCTAGKCSGRGTSVTLRAKRLVGCPCTCSAKSRKGCRHEL